MRHVPVPIPVLVAFAAALGAAVGGVGADRSGAVSVAPARVVLLTPAQKAALEAKAHPKPAPTRRLQVVRPRILRFLWPAKGRITGVYGNDDGRYHPGIDIGMLRSLTVRAASPGRVVHAGYTRGFEGYGEVVVERSGKYLLLYAHLSRVRVHPGQLVKPGRRLGVAGCTGYCTGTHLHFEVRRRGHTVNPMRLLANAR